jgi:hypothetical protein
MGTYRSCAFLGISPVLLTTYYQSGKIFPIKAVEEGEMHRLYITLVDLQLDAQNSNLFTCNTYIKILYMFRALP